MNGISKMSRMSYCSASAGPCSKLTGKTFDRIIIDEMRSQDQKIKWTSAGALRLRARRDDQFLGLSHADMNPVAQWCQEHRCGQRTSFDTWRFRNDEEITLFLLRWS